MGGLMKYHDFLEKQFFARNIVAPAFESAGFHKIATDIMDCGLFKNYSLCLGCNILYFNGASSCKQRFCPVCNHKRSMLYFNRFVPIFKNLLAQGYYINMLNFTIVDDSSLSHSLEVLTKAFRYICHESKEYSSVFKSMFVGGISSKEIKLGENSKLWHPHIHCLVVKDRYSQDFEYLKYIWNNAVRICGGYPSATNSGKYGSVFISSVVDKTIGDTQYVKSVESGVLETMKYITKFDYQLDNEYLPELVKTLKGVRSVNTWGCLRNIKSDVEDDMLKPYSEIYKCACTVCGGTDFFEFCSTHNLQDVSDFDLSNTVLIKEPKVNSGNTKLSSVVKLKNDLVLGQKYSDVVYSDLQAKFVGQYFQVEHFAGDTYIVRQFDSAQHELPPIGFGKDMFDFSNNCFVFEKNSSL